MLNNPNFHNLKVQSKMNNSRIVYSRSNAVAAARYITNNNPHPAVYNKTVSELISDFEHMMWDMVKNQDTYSGTAGYVILHADTYEHDGYTIYSFDVYVNPNFVYGTNSDELVTIERV